MKKQITREIDVDDDGIHCGDRCMFKGVCENWDWCWLYDNDLKKTESSLYSGKVERCILCLEENSEKTEEKKPKCKHCWHEVPYIMSTKKTEICCWCGAVKETPIEPITSQAWSSTEHGPYWRLQARFML